MDLLFKRYASPFSLLDSMMLTGRFLEFVLEVLKINNEEQLYELWLHKVFDKSFLDFKEAYSPRKITTKQEIETTIKENYEIMHNFIPEN